MAPLCLYSHLANGSMSLNHHILQLTLISPLLFLHISERDSGLMGGRDRGGRMSDMGPDKTDSDWRARPSADADDGPRRDDAVGESESGLILFVLQHPYLRHTHHQGDSVTSL